MPKGKREKMYAVRDRTVPRLRTSDVVQWLDEAEHTGPRYYLRTTATPRRDARLRASRNHLDHHPEAGLCVHPLTWEGLSVHLAWRGLGDYTRQLPCYIYTGEVVGRSRGANAWDTGLCLRHQQLVGRVNLAELYLALQRRQKEVSDDGVRDDI
jgi:hypothetical protein